MYDEAIDYLKEVEEGEEILIVHHWDMDGSASAAIISEILEEVRGEPADTIVIPKGRKHIVGERAETIIERKGIDHLIVLDMHVPVERISELREHGLDILIIDHHGFDTVPEDAVFVNPRLEDEEAYVPAAKLCNDISKDFGLELDWIAGMGVIQDFAVEGHEELFEELVEEYPHYFPDEITQRKLAKECRYGKYSAVLNIKPYKDSDRCARLAHDTLVKAEDLKEVEMQEEYADLKEYYREMHRELERVMERFDEEKEVHEERRLVFFRFDSDYHINSSVSTQISMEDEDWIYVVANSHAGEVNVSARCQSGRVDLGRILQDALPEGSDGEAGGHRKAAGATLTGGRLEEFRDNLLQVLENEE
ncbi:MAG: DHHA1 domain-containing protein [Candidatus Nanohaloarchaea archaeon]|nr:DHHA1 domain-containing protein [Candidatus Nanohaloarchaea archaeon]